MNNKVRYEYEVVVGDNNFNFVLNNREEAREELRKWKAAGFDAKIFQSVYSLQTKRQVR